MKIPATLTWREALIRQATSYRFVREYKGANAGEGVEWCQRATGNRPPDYWCMSYVVRVCLETFGRAAPVLVTGSCEEQRLFFERKGALRTRAEFDRTLASGGDVAVLGWVGLLVDMSTGKPHAHHTFFVGARLDIGTATERIAVAPPTGPGFYCTEGNAANPKEPGSRNGNGCYTGRIRGHVKDSGLYVFGDLAAI